MKHTLLYVLAIATLCSLAGCSRQEKNLFDQSAAERLHAMEQSVQDNLVSATSGWEMRYFPSPDDAGYAILAHFHNDGTVTMAAKNEVSSKNTYKQETSLWGVDGTQGCVLTFHSYNKLFSIFADPLDDGIGYYGDYEFVVLKNETNTIYLKGKKHGAYITMNRMTNVSSWEEYYAAVDDFNAKTFTDNDGIDMTYWDGAKKIQVIYNNGIFTYKNGDEEENRGFLVTPSGMDFYSGLPIAGSSAKAQHFVLSDDLKTLKTTDGKEYISSNYTPVEYFVYRLKKHSRWVYLADNSDAATRAFVDSVNAALKPYNVVINTIAYEVTSSKSQTGALNYNYGLRINYLFDGMQFGGRINFSNTITSDAITLKYKSHDEELKPLFIRLDASGADVPTGDGVEQIFCRIFAGTFVPESYTGSALNLTQLRFKRADGASIHVKAENVIM